MLYNKTISHISASKDSLWVVDRYAFKYDNVTKEFVKKGNRTVTTISAGLDDHAVMRSEGDYGLFGWSEEKERWRALGSDMVTSVASGPERLYKVDYESGKIF